MDTRLLANSKQVTEKAINGDNIYTTPLIHKPNALSRK